MSLDKRPIPPPIFTLRGHQAGVTAVHFISDFEEPWLISGDHDGVVIIWNLSTFRISARTNDLTQGRILSIRRIFHGKLKKDNMMIVFLVIQSREGFVKLVRLEEKKRMPEGENSLMIEELKSYPSSSILFSRGDAITIEDKSYLAHSSFIEDYQITLRVINVAFETIKSSSIKRPPERGEKSVPSCFDIKLISSSSGKQLFILVGYEDGMVYIFSCTIYNDDTPTRDGGSEELSREGLKIDILKRIETGLKEFITSFDYSANSDLLACGSPLDQVFLSDIKLFQADDEIFPKESEIYKHIVITPRYLDLKTNGLSHISFRPDSKLFAVALWNSQVRIYSSKNLKLLALLNHHLKQVEDIVFFEDKWMLSSEHARTSPKHITYLMVCASGDKTISLWSLFNDV